MIEWFVAYFLFVLWFMHMVSRIGVTSLPVAVRVGNVAHGAFGAFVASLGLDGLVVEALVGLFVYCMYMASRFVGFGVGVERGLVSFVGGYVFALVSRVLASL